MRTVLLTLFTLLLNVVGAQPDSARIIKVCFLYGSKPARKCKTTEVRFFGGLHGGHVSIQYRDTDYGFEPTCSPVHVFPKRQRQSAFVTRELNRQARYSPDSKTVTFLIPVSAPQLATLDSIHKAYCAIAPYDYAFFGMRCAAATQDILASAGIIERRNRFATIFTAFYPKRLRLRLFRLAKKEGYALIRTNGKASRKWEND